MTLTEKLCIESSLYSVSA